MDLMTLVAKFTADTTQFERGIKSAQSSMEKGRASAEKLDATLGKLKTAFAAAVSVAGVAKIASTLKSLSDSTAAAADRIDKQSQALGMSRKAFQQWDYILGQSGASIDSLGVSMKTLNSAILNPTDGTKEALNALGLNLEQLNGLSQEDAFETMVRQFQKLPEGATKSALAMQMFGRQGQALMPLLNSADGTIDQLRADMAAMGFEMSDAMVDAGVKYGDTMDNLKRTLQGVSNILGYSLMESFTGIAEEITKFFSQEDVQDAVKQLAVNINTMGDVVLSHVQEFFKWLTDHTGDIITIVSNITEFVGDIAGVVLPALAAYAAFKLVTNPITLIAAGVAAIAANWPTIKEFFTAKVPEWVNQTFGIDISEFKLPDPLEAVNKIKAWWNGNEDGGGVKNLVAKFLDWYLQAPGEPQGDPIAVIKAWWEEKKQQAQDAIKWALSLPSAPHEGGEKLRKTILEWWDKHKTRAEEAIKWVLSLPTMPEVTGENGIVTKIKKWWTEKVVPGLAGTVDFLSGLFGIPSQEDINKKLGEVQTAINGFFNGEGLEGIVLPEWVTSVLGGIQDAWDWITDAVDTVVSTISGFFSGKGLENIALPDWATTVLGGIQEAWDWITDSVDAVKSTVNSFFDKIKPSLPSWVGTVLTPIEAAWNAITTAIQGVTTNLTGFFTSTFSNPPWKGLVDGITTTFNTVKEAIQGAIDKLGEWFGVSNDEDDDWFQYNPTDADSHYNAAGLDYIPRNGYRSVLHEGEAVLNKRDAEEWRRGGNNGATASEIASAVFAVFEGMSVVMDGNTVGKLTARTVSREIEREARAGRFVVA